MSKSPNIYWIDAVKAICMFSVYLLHSEQYYGMGDISYGRFLMPFYVNAFFFVSGYLFFRKQMKISQSVLKPQNFKNGLVNLLYRLVIPTIIFSSFLYLPKMLFHENSISIYQYFHDVFGGVSYWFTSALAVAQIIIMIVLFLSNRVGIFSILAISAVLWCLGWYLFGIDTDPFPWNYKKGMIATLFMAVGGLYQKYESEIDKAIGLYGYVAVSVIYIIIMLIYGIRDSILINGIISILGIAFITGLCKLLPPVNILGFIGKNSIILYFFSGVMPAMTGLLFKCIIPEARYIVTLLVMALSVTLGLVCVLIINKYMPFLIDLRKLSFLSNEN